MGAGRRDLFVRPSQDPHHSCQHQVGLLVFSYVLKSSINSVSSFAIKKKRCSSASFYVFYHCTEPFLSFHRSLSVILILDLSKPNALWGTMEKLLQAAQARLEKVFSQAQQAERAKPGAKHQTALHSAACILPKDYPVRLVMLSVTPSHYISAFVRCRCNMTLVSWVNYVCAQDRELISPFPVPLLIIGSKYDVFQVKTQYSNTYIHTYIV